MPAKRDLEVRFWEKVDKNGPLGCWIWTAYIDTHGYGRFVVMNGKRGKSHGAHRISWLLARGPIPDGLHLDHICRTRACVNPDHLEPVTNEENIRRGVWSPIINARKTHCTRGHALTEDNVYRPPSRPHTRQCRLCVSIRDQKRAAAQRSEGRTVRPSRPYKSIAKSGYIAPSDRTHCKHGHEFTEENTYRPPGRPHTRQCRTCQRRRETDSLKRRQQAVGSSK